MEASREVGSRCIEAEVVKKKVWNEMEQEKEWRLKERREMERNKV